jgi:hypothetical protein
MGSKVVAQSRCRVITSQPRDGNTKRGFERGFMTAALDLSSGLSFVGFLWWFLGVGKGLAHGMSGLHVCVDFGLRRVVFL